MDYEPNVLDSDNPNIANSHVNGYVSELELANQVADLPNEVVLKYGDKIGRNGSDVISVNTETGEITFWDSKYRSGSTTITESPTFTGDKTLKNALDEATATVKNSNLDPELEQKILNNLVDGNYTTNTVGAGQAKNSVQTRVCNFKVCS